MNRWEMEQNLARRIGSVEMRWFRKLRALIGDKPGPIPAEFWAEMAADLAKTLHTVTEDAGLKWLQDYLSGLPVGIDWTEALVDAEAWAQAYSTEWGGKITDNTRKLHEQITAKDVDRETYLARMAGRFSPVHAETIGITETTRARGWAAKELEKRLSTQGIATQRRWLTAEDERVCPICAPLDHLLAREWEPAHPDWPPAHPNCRCHVSVELVKAGMVG